MESLRGRPFIGQSGQLLEKVLRSIDVERERLWITNATLCLPKGSTSDLEKARACCRPRLDAEMSKLPRSPALLLGAVAARSFLGDKFKITELAGSLHEVDGRSIIPTIHPAAILRGGAGTSKQIRAGELGIWNLMYDAGKVAALARGEPVQFSEDIEISTDDPDRAYDLMIQVFESALHTGMVAIDTETTGLDSRKVQLTAIGIATTEVGISLAYSVCDHRVWSVLREMARDPNIATVFHNRQYDEMVLERYGLQFAGERHDTMLMHHAAFPGAEHKLQRVATQFFAIRPWKAEFRHGSGSVEELCSYNAKDALTTARLVGPLQRCIERTNAKRCYEADNALAPVAMRMTKIGIPISRERNRELADQFLDVIRRTCAEIETKANDPLIRDRFIDHLAYQMARKTRKGDPPDFISRHRVRVRELAEGVRGKSGKILKGKGPVEFSISNSDHLVSFIQAMGHRISKMTATGKYSGDKDVLESLAYIDDVRKILEYKEAAYNYSHFVRLQTDDQKGLVLDHDRLHSDWDIHKITGRWGSSPNVQNWPKANSKGRPNLRSQVIAPPGRIFVGADFAQLEARIIGLLSGDPFLVSVFMANYGECAAGCKPDTEPVKFCPLHDMHTVFGCAVFPNFLEHPARKELRDLVKRGEYGGFYGGAVQTLYASIVKEFPEVTLADVAKIVQIISERMPGVSAWHQRLMQDAVQKGEIRSAILGRRRAFPLGHADPTVVYNHPVQSTGADIMNLGLLALVPHLPKGAEPIIQGHDALIVECWEDDAEYVRERVTKHLSQTHTVGSVTMRFPAEADIARSWDKL